MSAGALRLRNWVSEAAIVLGLAGMGALGVAAAWLRYAMAWGTGDALYDAIVARQLLRGEGYTTLVAPLGMLRYLDSLGLGTAPPWLSLHKFPLSALRVAVVFWLAGVRDSSVVLASAVFHPVNLVLIYVLGR